MKIVITPAKKMTNDASFLEVESLPVYLETTEKILNHLKTLTISEVKKMLGCSDRIAKEAYDNYQSMDLRNNLTCAILAYQGIQYDYMASHVMSYDDFAFLQQHLGWVCLFSSHAFGVFQGVLTEVSYDITSGETLAKWHLKFEEALFITDENGGGYSTTGQKQDSSSTSGDGSTTGSGDASSGETNADSSQGEQ